MTADGAGRGRPRWRRPEVGLRHADRDRCGQGSGYAVAQAEPFRVKPVGAGLLPL
ncbi:hypothetical protein Mco01_74800 [Microbispora corallina]|uniref:Uncharacterized protein n=1 Tax=Microbispora corallina TaxID=83302 RepID=A0ABQ4GBL0_9ACTN|nr:hypothetical protein Mco01_74800 [Microbispora corallina]